MSLEPETVSVKQAKAITSLGHTKVYELIGTGELQTVKVGRRRLVRLDSIRRLTGARVAA